MTGGCHDDWAVYQAYRRAERRRRRLNNAWGFPSAKWEVRTASGTETFTRNDRLTAWSWRWHLARVRNSDVAVGQRLRWGHRVGVVTAVVDGPRLGELPRGYGQW